MGNSSTILAFASLLTMAPGATVLAGSPSSIDHRQVVELIAQLGSTRFQDREAATHALEAIGGPALEALERAALSNDPEVGRRAQNLAHSVRRQLDTAHFLEPLRVRLVYHETPVLKAVEDFANKTGFPITVSEARPRLATRNITLDTGVTSFWEAFQQFCQKAGLQERMIPSDYSERVRQQETLVIRPFRGAMRLADLPSSSLGASRPWDGRLTLMDGRSPPRPTYQAGAVRIRALPAKEALPDAQGREISFLIEITPQPKSAWQQVVELRIDKALDACGQDVACLLDPPSDGSPFGAPGNGAMLWDAQSGQPLPACRDIPVRFKSPERHSGILKEVRGVVVAQIQTEPQIIVTVEDVLKVLGRSFVGDEGDSLSVAQAERTLKGDVQLRIELIDASSPNPFWVMRGGVMRPNRLFRRGAAMIETNPSPAQFVFLDREGQSLPLRGRTEETVINGNSLARHITLTYHCGHTEPGKLIYSRRRTILIEIPFTLHDVPLS
jgi:hypothetical protein